MCRKISVILASDNYRKRYAGMILLKNSGDAKKKKKKKKFENSVHPYNQLI